ncbi:type IV toxin-antitoxin system AbiEi family antitoxin domain-containing protein [Phycicoccus sp. SLBN-51]|uniref:type IV toxin-antitoxin system AbiEi family antitoxin domain-containing protein n=1 Tax=Phycicoccus sp. SLBN-51 TaxID=2768447 RepID=UPI00116A6DFC|nr:type IV toxin-antitoxin system AbiEi family antitoxin domain-containing protein [Phycicoccus sp. SLBN-51]TQJ49271.1 putative AbiEi antitoxin of type IV toxin-antitoxin system [Phycicoccus sp. SLBN-51]
MTARSALWEIAVDQYGFFTSKDAADLGIARTTIQQLVYRGGLDRVAHGVYRFREMPVSEYDDYMLAVLWTGAPEACLSHETALALYDVCDINPTRVHLTLPRGRRVRRSGGDGYALHYEDLPPDQVGWLHQIRATKPAPTVAQCIESGVPAYLIRQAVENGRRRGLLLEPEARQLVEQLEGREG